MINDVNKKLEDIKQAEGTKLDKKREVIDTVYEVMKDDENLYEEVKEIIEATWDGLHEEESDHIRVQLDNEYRQAIRNFNKNLDRAMFQRQGREEKGELLEAMVQLKEESDYKKITKRLYDLKDAWEESAYAGKEFDAELNNRFKQMFDEMLGAKEEYFGAMEEHRKSARELKEALIKRAQEASTSTRWKDTSKEMKELMDEWKAAGNAGREENDSLWEQFQSARQVFFQNQEAYFDKMREHQEESFIMKAALIKEAQAICDNENIKETAEQMRELMDRWKKAGSAGREKEDELWTQFQAARQVFYDRQGEYYEQRRGKFKDNLYEGIKRRNKQIIDLEQINKELEMQIAAIRNLDPVLGNQEDRWEITNERNQELAKLQEYLDGNNKQIATIRETLKDMDEKYQKLDNED